jgi:hypothetical protein
MNNIRGLDFNVDTSLQEPVVETTIENVSPDVIETNENSVQEATEPTSSTVTLESLTNNKFKSIEEIEALASEYEALKNQPKFEYKSEFTKELDDFISKGGDAYKFIEASRINTKDLSPIDIARNHCILIEGMTKEEADNYLADEYKQVEDPEYYGYTQGQIDIATRKLERESKKMLQEIEEFKTKATYIDPKASEQKVAGLTPEQEAANNKVAQELMNAATSFSGSDINFSEGDISANVKIPVFDVEFMKTVASNPSAIFDKFTNEKGDIDYVKFMRVANFIANPDKYDQSIIKTAHSQGRESLLNNVNNVSNNQATKGDFANTIIPEGMSQRDFILNQIE